AVLEMPDAEPLGNLQGAGRQSVGDRCRDDGRAAVHAERCGAQRASEKDAPDEYERQDADDRARRILRVEIERLVPQARLEDPLPPGAMEERGVRTLVDERIPARESAGLELADPNRPRLAVHDSARLGTFFFLYRDHQAPRFWLMSGSHSWRLTR